jgi:hypothetical protein
MTGGGGRATRAIGQNGRRAMTIGKAAIVATVLALAIARPAEVRAAEEEAASCVDDYLGCINEASQESGAFWRTAKEFECGVDYYACMRKKVVGV